MADTATPDPANQDASSRAGGLAILRWLLIVAVSFGVLAAGMIWLSRSTTIASPVAEPAGDDAYGDASADSPYPAPSFRLASLEGGRIGPPDFPGQVVLVEFWATWCGPCRLQAKFLEQLHEELDGDGVQLLAIAVGEDEATVREYVARKPFSYPVLLDPEDSLGPRYQIYGLPTVMIVDRQGVISFLETGVSDTVKLRHELAAAGAEI